jgi:hypothetical protein
VNADKYFHTLSFFIITCWYGIFPGSVSCLRICYQKYITVGGNTQTGGSVSEVAESSQLYKTWEFRLCCSCNWFVMEI